MRKSLLIGSLFLLQGCNLLPHLFSSRHMPGHLNILVMGQSNAAFMSPLGIQTMQRELPVNASIVDCAVGGTFIREWMPGTADYNNCLALVPKPDAIIWYQGESDAEFNGEWSQWGMKFQTIVSSLRQQAGHIPIVYARIANEPQPSEYYPAGTFPHWQDVRDQQDAIFMLYSAEIKTDDIEVRPDYVHFTDAGYQILGQRFGQALSGLLQGGE